MQGSAWRPALLALARRIGLFANRSSKAHLGWLPPLGLRPANIASHPQRIKMDFSCTLRRGMTRGSACE